MLSRCRNSFSHMCIILDLRGALHWFEVYNVTCYAYFTYVQLPCIPLKYRHMLDTRFCWFIVPHFCCPYSFGWVRTQKALKFGRWIITLKPTIYACNIICLNFICLHYIIIYNNTHTHIYIYTLYIHFGHILYEYTLCLFMCHIHSIYPPPSNSR